MRDHVLWKGLVALLMSGMLVAAVGALATEGAPGGVKVKGTESESGVVMPGQAEGFNPQPEPPAFQTAPEPPGSRKVAHPPEEPTPRLMDPGDDGKKVTPRAIDPVDK